MRPEEPSKAQFVPRRWPHNGHLQAIAGKPLPRPSRLPAPECRLFHVEQSVAAPDGYDGRWAERAMVEFISAAHSEV